MTYNKLQIYTGDGKGKTTSAIGLLIRALGYDKKIVFVQFLKNQITGEELFFKKYKIKNLTFKKYGSEKFILNKKIKEKDISEAKKAIDFIENEIENKKFDILILDEINVVIYYKLIDIKKIKEIIKKCKNKKIELIFTGRKLNKEIKELADLITDNKEIKHYYPKTKQRKGIEY